MSRVRSARPQRRAPRDRSRSGRSGIWTHSRITSPRRKNAWRGAPAGVGSSRMRRRSKPAASSVAIVRSRSGENATTWSIRSTPFGCGSAESRSGVLDRAVAKPSSASVPAPRNDQPATRFPACGSSRTRTVPMSQQSPSIRNPRSAHSSGESQTTSSSIVTAIQRVSPSRDSIPPMRGITVVGCGLDSGELQVARALADALGDAEVVPTLDQPAAASPVIAVRHTGNALEPPGLVEAVREAGENGLVVAAAPGGLMAPLTEHYSNRDFARELGLPLVIAARATGGVSGQVRLVGEAARAVGLTVAAVVLTEWPDPPNRIQLDERELLSKLARVPVVALPDLDRVDVPGLLDAVGPPPPAEEAPQPAEPTRAEITLDPYDAWQPRQVGDPRNTPRPQIMQAMLDIVEAEGPMTATRAYS